MPTAKTYTLTANENVFCIISSVKFQGNVSTSVSNDVDSDDRDYLDITLETVSEYESAPDNYGKEAVITVSSIAGLTPKGEYKITVQRSTDSGEWENAKVVIYDVIRRIFLLSLSLCSLSRIGGMSLYSTTFSFASRSKSPHSSLITAIPRLRPLYTPFRPA